MPFVFDRVRSILVDILRPPSPSLLDAVFRAVHADAAGPIADAAPHAGSRIDRLRPQRRDLAAALGADPAAPQDELTTWPPASGPPGACQGC